MRTVGILAGLALAVVVGLVLIDANYKGSPPPTTAQLRAKCAEVYGSDESEIMACMIRNRAKELSDIKADKERRSTP